MNIASSRELIDKVVKTGLCAYCGACTGGCPYLVPHKGKIVLLNKCTLTDGECYHCCPRTYTDLDALSQQVFGVPYSGEPIGTTREVFIARATEGKIREKAQYGGTVTALLSLALSEGFISGAVVAGTSEDKVPTGSLIETKEEMLAHAGSSYMACPVLEACNRIPSGDSRPLGVVALPCQVMAIRKMQMEPPENRFDAGNIKLVVGLFCTWALSPDGFHRFLQENVDLGKVKKFDIPPPPASEFDVYTESGKVSFPLDEIRKFIMSGCHYYLDMTAEFADISVGAAEGIEGWNTVIVRTETGAKLMEMAKTKGVLETRELPAQSLAHLSEAALNKKKHAIREIIRLSGDSSNLLYLGIPQALVDRLLAE